MFLQIAPFVDNEGKVAMQGTAVLLKLYEGKEDMMQKVINDYTVSLGEASKEQLGELNGKLDKTKYNEYVENGEGLLDQFGFNILPYEILPSSEKTKDWSLDVSHFYIEDVNRYLNVVFIEPEEMGLFSGYMLNDGIYSSDGDLIGHVPDSVLSQTNEMSKVESYSVFILFIKSLILLTNYVWLLELLLLSFMRMKGTII